MTAVWRGSAHQLLQQQRLAYLNISSTTRNTAGWQAARAWKRKAARHGQVASRSPSRAAGAQEDAGQGPVDEPGLLSLLLDGSHEPEEKNVSGHRRPCCDGAGCPEAASLSGLLKRPARAPRPVSPFLKPGSEHATLQNSCGRNCGRNCELLTAHLSALCV